MAAAALPLGPLGTTASPACAGDAPGWTYRNRNWVAAAAGTLGGRAGLPGGCRRYRRPLCPQRGGSEGAIPLLGTRCRRFWGAGTWCDVRIGCPCGTEPRDRALIPRLTTLCPGSLAPRGHRRPSRSAFEGWRAETDGNTNRDKGAALPAQRGHRDAEWTLRLPSPSSADTSRLLRLHLPAPVHPAGRPCPAPCQAPAPSLAYWAEILGCKAKGTASSSERLRFAGAQAAQQQCPRPLEMRLTSRRRQRSQRPHSPGRPSGGWVPHTRLNGQCLGEWRQVGETLALGGEAAAGGPPSPSGGASGLGWLTQTSRTQWRGV